MKTPRELNAPGNDNNFDDQNLPKKIGSNSSDHTYRSGKREPDPIEIKREQHGGFFSRIDTSFPLSGGETDEDLYKVLNSDDTHEEFKRTPKDTHELSDNDLDVDNDDYRLNDGE